MPTRCIIEFDNNPSCTFFGGEILNTKISLYLDETKEVTGIAFKIYGNGIMHWSDNDDSYSGAEDYINIKTFLLGRPDSEPITIKAGEHIFSHCYQLPLTSPSSVKSQYGQIRYEVKVMLVRPRRFDKTFTKKFTINKFVDLNYEPMIACPIIKKLEKSPDSQINLCVSLPQSGYVPGQIIPVGVSFANESGKIIKKLKVSLVMIASCYSTGPFKKAFDCVVKIAKLKRELLANENKCDSIFELLVPPTPPSDDQLSNVVHISYQVEVEIVMPKFQLNQAVIVPVFVGNVPLTNNLSHNKTGSTIDEKIKGIYNSSKSDTSQALLNLPWNNGASNIPPPTYKEASFMSTTNSKKGGDSGDDANFVPQYPVFNVALPTIPTPSSSHKPSS